jgi:hypothetical protein
MVEWSARTFAALAKVADFSALAPAGVEVGKSDDGEETDEGPHENEALTSKKRQSAAPTGLRPEFHYNIQIHLPGNGTEETYLNIFNALRRTFK